jgi:hypothetical protein
VKEDGSMVFSFAQIKEVAFQHFSILYIELPLSHQEYITKLLKHIPQVISQQDNINLSDTFEESEIFTAIQQMELDKVPGPDGFSTHFYKLCWNIIKFDLVHMVRYVQKSARVGGSTNSSFLALVPKEVNPSSFIIFIPISLSTMSPTKLYLKL